jgi:hypothetical protein
LLFQINELNGHEAAFEGSGCVFSRRDRAAKYNGSMHPKPAKKLTALKSKQL